MSQISQYDRTLALNLGKTRIYPSRQTLLNFGKTICHVKYPEEVIERCADAMSETLKAERDRVPSDLLKSMGDAWDEGRSSVAPASGGKARE